MQSNNMKAMREALSKFCTYSAVVLNTGMFNRVHLEALLNIAKAALAEPPRNCDVGTVEEQTTKFLAWCRDRAGGHENIPNVCIQCVRDCGETERLCSIAWAQMPYEEGGKE